MIEEGDLLLLSDPYSVGGAISHSNDWLVVLPVFRRGRLTAWTANVRSPVRYRWQGRRLNADRRRSIFEEGVRIPPIKIWSRGVYNQEVMRLLMHQTRVPDWCKADLNALIASCRIAARRGRGNVRPVRRRCVRLGRR